MEKLRLASKLAQSLQHNADIVKRNMDTSAPPSSRYDILISVFQPRPDQQNVRWDVRSAIDSKYQCKRR